MAIRNARLELLIGNNNHLNAAKRQNQKQNDLRQKINGGYLLSNSVTWIDLKSAVIHSGGCSLTRTHNSVDFWENVRRLELLMCDDQDI